MMVTRRFACAGLAAMLSTSLATSVTAQNAPVFPVGGLYVVYGMNADGSKYTGQVQILQVGTSVELYWNVGGQQYSGRGVLNGSVMTVDWGASTPVIYVLVGNELHGTWDGGNALEKLVLQ